MNQVLFLKLEKSLEEVALLIFNALDLKIVKEGDSSFYTGGQYYEYSIMGMDMKVSDNNYDYEDEYNFMISIKKSIGFQLDDENLILSVSELIACVIADRLNIEVSMEMLDDKTKEPYLRVFAKNNVGVIGSKVKKN